jgi:hypothetical protein
MKSSLACLVSYVSYLKRSSNVEHPLCVGKQQGMDSVILTCQNWMTHRQAKET